MYIDPSWTDPLAQEITKRTGVTLDVTVPASDDEEGEMNKLIASGELADLIFRGGGQSKVTLQDGGYVKPLDELIDQYGPNIKQNLGGSFPAWKNRKDGKIYCIGFWYFNKTVKPALNLGISTLYMRYDLLKEMGYAKLERGADGDMNSFITWKEYYDLLDDVKIKYPDLTPALVAPNAALDLMYRGMGKQIHNGYIWENNTATDFVFSIDALKSMTEVNSIYQKGYAKIDDTTTSDEARTALMADGKVFSSLGYSVASAQVPLSKDNEEKRFVMFYLRQDDAVNDIYLNHAWGDAFAGTHINAKLDDAKTKRAMEFIDYLCSIEGSMLVCAGIEGKDYFEDPATGWYKPSDEVFKGYREWDANILKKTGVGAWFNILPCLAGVNKDGHCMDINSEYAFMQDKWVMYNNTDWKHFADNWIVSPYLSLEADAQADAVDAESKIGAYKLDRMTNIMLTKDPATIEGELAKLQAQMKTDGIEALEKAQTDNWIMIATEKGRTPETINLTVAQQN